MKKLFFTLIASLLCVIGFTQSEVGRVNAYTKTETIEQINNVLDTMAINLVESVEEDTIVVINNGELQYYVPTTPTGGYTISGMALGQTIAASKTYSITDNVIENAFNSYHQLPIPVNGTIKSIVLRWYAGAVSSNEDVILKLYVDGSLNSAVDTVATTSISKVFTNTNMNVPVTTSNYISLAITTPAWSVVPTGVYLNWIIYIE